MALTRMALDYETERVSFLGKRQMSQVPIDDAVLADIERYSLELSGSLEATLLSLSSTAFQVNT